MTRERLADGGSLYLFSQAPGWRERGDAAQFGADLGAVLDRAGFAVAQVRVWLLYGLSIQNVPLILVDAFGLVCSGITLAVTLSVRGSLLHPATWSGSSAEETGHLG